MQAIRLISQKAERARALVAKLESFPPLLARLTLGGLFMSTGWGKVHNLAKVTSFFTDLHIPAPAFNAVLVSYTELIGGALLVLGLASRFAAIPLAISMIVALVTAKADEISGLADLFGTVEFTYLVLLLGIVIGGPGRWSADRLVSSGIGRASLGHRAEAIGFERV